MHIAIYSAFFSPTSIAYIKTVIEYLNANDHQFILVDRLKKHLGEEGETYDYFKDDVALEKKVDFLFSVGGDGTLLRSIAVIRDSKIPILGINAGRLGFLTSIKKDTLQDGLDLFFRGKYSIVERSLLAVATKEPTEALQEFGFALNEVTINRKNTTSMLSIHTKLNDQFLTTYWSDGLIIATPTGSTGYSLSSGGPIVTPTSKCLVVNPIAPHNINMRPLIVPDDTAFEINVQGRGNTHLLSLDSRILTLENGNDIYIKKAEFSA
jgi:NAD+ kinase